jgi:hypothetical protein
MFFRNVFVMICRFIEVLLVIIRGGDVCGIRFSIWGSIVRIIRGIVLG